ncbi:MAG: trigger factor, partial [Alphaproteobacteria bacterium]|nr:trigger factor [Alphaproteobacteria bacterium]
MHVQLLSSDGLTREFKVVIPANDLNAKKKDYIKSRAHKVKIDGFRPGKVPAHLLEQRLGGDAFNHALRTSIDQSIKTTAKDHNLQYINEPKVDFEEFDEGKDLAFTLTFEVMPEIETKDFSGIKLDKLVVDVADTEVEKSLKDLHENHTAFKPEEGRAAKKGDRVSCDISLTQGGKKLAGYQNLSATVDVGAKTFILSDMDDQVLGAKEGETKTFSSTVADNFGDKKLAGKSVDVTLIVKSVLAPKAFKIDDEFAKEFGKDTLDALKKDMKEGLERNYTGIARLYLKRHLLDELEKMYDFPLPESMVKSEFDAIWKHLQNEMEKAKAAGENI